MKAASAQESPSSDGEGEEEGGERKGEVGGGAAGRYEGEEAIFSRRANQTKDGEIRKKKTKICALFVLLTVKSSDSCLMNGTLLHF